MQEKRLFLLTKLIQNKKVKETLKRFVLEYINDYYSYKVLISIIRYINDFDFCADGCSSTGYGG